MTHEALEVVRVPVSVTLPKELVEWLDQQVEKREYHNRSHAVEIAVLELKQKKE